MSRPPDLPTLLGGRVSVGEEAEVALVVPADQGHVASHHGAGLATLLGSGGTDQHALGQACAVTLPGAQQAAAVDLWWTHRQTERQMQGVRWLSG